MKSIILTISFVAMIRLAYSQQYAYHPKYITVLGANKGKACLKQCSRSVPEKVQQFYKIMTADSLLFIQNFKKILEQKEDGNCCRVIKSLDDHCYQLVGVIIRNRKYIYISAFSYDKESDLDTEDLRKWKTDPIIVCDGGNYIWGALFDPAKRSFSQLSFNGVG